MTPAVFEPATLAGERPQTHTVERATTGIGWRWKILADVHHIVITITGNIIAYLDQFEPSIKLPYSITNIRFGYTSICQFSELWSVYSMGQ
jgi:hypothetical protein